MTFMDLLRVLRLPAQSPRRCTVGPHAFGASLGQTLIEAATDSPALGASFPILPTPSRQTAALLTAFGATAVTFMIITCLREQASGLHILAFAAGCLLPGAYGFLAGTWPASWRRIWALIALQRYRTVTR